MKIKTTMYAPPNSVLFIIRDIETTPIPIYFFLFSCFIENILLIYIIFDFFCIFMGIFFKMPILDTYCSLNLLLPFAKYLPVMTDALG